MTTPEEYQVTMTRKIWTDLYMVIDEAKSLKGLYYGEDKREFLEMIENAEKALEALRPQKT